MARRNSHPKYRQFRFDTGSLSLNFVATVRHRGSQPRDLLSTPEALMEWLRLVGLLPSSAPISSTDHQKALVLREAIHGMIKAVILKNKPRKSDIALINRVANFPIATPQLHADADRVLWQSKHPVRACLAVIARDAVTLLGGVEREHLKMCDSGSCQMLFLDTSPSRGRRWCAMSICGNRQKVALHRRRIKSPSPAAQQSRTLGD
jgi:predicted RNA-binding Zn ribbon-like protein